MVKEAMPRDTEGGPTLLMISHNKIQSCASLESNHTLHPHNSKRYAGNVEGILQ